MTPKVGTVLRLRRDAGLGLRVRRYRFEGGALDRLTNRAQVEAMLAAASARHAALLPQLPPEVQASLPVDAQGITEAIDFLAQAAGLSAAQRRTLVRPHAVNPAVMHARVFGAAPLAEETIMGSFVEGARVRADALVNLAESIGGAALGSEVRALLVEHPLPLAGDCLTGVPVLRAAYEAHERAVVTIATRLDDRSTG
jgi:hypothetical protein